MIEIPAKSAAVAAVLVAAVLAGPPAAAQAPAERVAVHTDWSVFTPGDPKECYIVSPPTSWEARRGNTTVTDEVSRGDIRLFVSFRPAEDIANEVSYTSGYPFREGSTVRIEIGSSSFELSTGAGEANEWAWPASPEQDAEIVAAMRRGSTARITGVSSRGTSTVDTFSLMGFTDALEDAQARCE
jgi:Invasion associated locus B (IalB) protein